MAKEQAMMAFELSRNIKEACHAKTLIIISDILMEGYNKKDEKILQFSLLPLQKKRDIRDD